MMDALREVRSRSGAPIVECKKALGAVAHSEDDGDAAVVVERALDWLREHGAGKAASKVRDREASEGLVAIRISDDSRSGSLVQVGSETDFAGRSGRFLDLVTTVAGTALRTNQGEDGIVPIEALLAAAYEDSGRVTGKTVKDLLDEAVVAIRENLVVSYAAKIRCVKHDDSIVVGYVHNRMGTSLAGTAAAIVEVGSADPAQRVVDTEALEGVGKKLAMHVVAAQPRYLRREDVPIDVVDRERDVLRKQQEQEGKSPEIAERIVQGRLRKFFESTCLLEQPHFIEEANPKVGPFLKERGIVVRRFEARTISSSS
jgi:elongation factor Ts